MLNSRKRIADLQRAVPGDDRPIALGQPHGTPQLARRHAAKPVVGLRRPPSGQRSFVAVEAAHPRAMHRNLATMEADLALGPAPAVADAASAAAMRRAGPSEPSGSRRATPTSLIQHRPGQSPGHSWRRLGSAGFSMRPNMPEGIKTTVKINKIPSTRTQ